MRRRLVTVAGALTAALFAAGCSTAVSGNAASGTRTPTMIPGHVYSASPHSAGLPSRSDTPTAGRVTAACPLLPAATVGKVVGDDGAKGVEKNGDEPGVYTCRYSASGVPLVSFSVRTTVKSMARPDHAKKLFGKLRGLCQDPEKIPGLGPHSVLCRLKKQPKLEAGYVGHTVGDQYAVFSVIVPAGDGAVKTVSTLASAVVSNLPG